MLSFLLIALFAVAPLRSLQSYLAVRDYRPAVEAYSAHIKRNPKDAAALRDLARVYDHWHRYDSSLYWWNRSLEALPGFDSSRVGRWTALYRVTEQDSSLLAVARGAIRQEALAALAGPDSAGLEALTLASHGLALAEAPEAESVGNRLIERFPDSPRAYELIVTTFYDSLYPIWTNDTLKVPMLRRFVARWPRTEWRTTIWQYLLSSLYTLRDTAAVLATVESVFGKLAGSNRHAVPASLTTPTPILT